MKILFKKRGKGISARELRYSEINFVPIDQFKQRLLLERRRAERLNVTSSVMIVSILKSNSKDQEIRDLKLNNLVTLFCQNLRETDAVSLYNQQRIIILLPDTDMNGAQYVNKILNQQVNQFIQEKGKNKIFSPDEFTVEIVPFPDKYFDNDFEEEKKVIKNRDNDEDDFLSKIYKKNKTYANNSRSYFLNACIGCNDGNIIISEISQPHSVEKDGFAKMLHLMHLGVKRFFDIVASLILMILFSPLFAVISIIIKLTSEGPVIFTQKRVGYNGRLFDFYKFRSMYNNNDEHIHKNYIKSLISGKYDAINNGSEEDPLFKMKDDPRVTPIGRFLRKTSLDELPQLWNVLKGDMSLIGPRPPIPYEVEAYKTWHLRRLIEMKPGITGLWQVSGRNKLTFDDQVRLDIKYTKRWSFLLDLKILFKTIPVVIFPTGN